MKRPISDRFRREAIIVFLLTVIALFLITTILWDGVYMAFSPDGKLYISIADNFVETGHFIQTARSEEIGFVVPFGMPIILTILRLLGAGDAVIVIFHYILIGATFVLLYRAEKNTYGAGGFAPCVLLLALYFTGVAPRNIYVEHYYMFWLSLLLCLVTEKEMKTGKRLFWMNFAAFWAFVTRPVLSVVYAAVLIYTVIRTVKKDIPWRRMILAFLIPAVILTANAAVNYRECGHWVWLENYSARDVCYANNSISGFDWGLSKEEARDEEMQRIFELPDLDTSEKSALYKQHAMECIRNDFGRFLKNTVIKGYRLFIGQWKLTLLLAVVGAIGLMRQFPDKKRQTACMLALGAVEAVISSMGVLIFRYSYFIWLTGALHIAALGHCGLWWLRSLRTKKNVGAPE